MTLLRTLRDTRTFVRLGRLVLAWFVLSLGVAVASPLVKPQAMEMVCSGSGIVKMVVHTDDGAQEVASHALDCPMCIGAGAPPPVPQAAVPTLAPLAHALTPLYAAYIQALTAAPLSARAPPAL
jgi:hypothetical protein